MNKKLGLALAATFVLTGHALAADLARKTPPPPVVAVVSWTGFYAGINGGGAWTDDPFCPGERYFREGHDGWDRPIPKSLERRFREKNWPRLCLRRYASATDAMVCARL